MKALSFLLFAINTFYCLSITGAARQKHEITYLFQEVSSEEKIVNESFPEITNFNYYISPYFQTSHGCLLIINNYLRANLRLHYPAIHRSPTPVKVIMNHPNRLPPANYTNATVWAIGAVTFETIFDNRSVRCASSLFAGIELTKDSPEIDDFCVRLNFRHFARIVKPWNYLVHFHLYPLMHLEHKLKIFYPRVFKFNLGYYYTFKFPSHIPPVHHLVHVSRFLKGFSRERLRKWVAESRRGPDASTSVISQDIFILNQVLKLDETFDATLLQSKGKIETATVLKVYPFAITTLKRPPDFDSLLHLVYSQASEQLPWYIQDGDEEKGVLQQMMTRLNLCSQLSTEEKVKSPTERVSYAYARLWQSLMRNFTIVSGQFEIQNVCINGVIEASEVHKDKSREEGTIFMQPISYVKSFLYFNYFDEEQMSTLRFISCGKGELTSISLTNLTSTFQTKVWISIILSAVAVSATILASLAANLQKMDISRYFLSVMQVLLEQSSAFVSEEVFRARLKMVVGTYLIMGIVLSNAYKNDNVYTMLTPRRLIPYEKFEKLVQDGFSIFTRILGLLGDEGMFKADLLQTIRINKSFDVRVVTEVGRAMERLQRLVSLNVTENGDPETVTRIISGTALVKLGILNKTRFHPGITTDVRKLLDTNDIATIKSEKKKELIALEYKHLLNSLKTCNRTAVILPEHMCWESGRALKRNHSLKSVYIGKESYSDINWIFVLSGYVPPHIIRRVKTLGASGIWQMWMKSFLGSLSFQVGPSWKSEVEAPNLEGNIVVIFYVWLIGIGICLFSFVLESWFFFISIYKKKRNSEIWLSLK